jgi:DNA-binding LacI/PurR family transcriptional regulator
MVKLKDVAEKADVSLATASLALNDSKLIKEETKNEVLYWAEKINYIPNIYARKLAKGKSYNICIMINSKNFFESPNIYYLKIIGGVIRESEDTEYTVSFSFYRDKEELKLLSKRRNKHSMDGIMILDVIEKNMLDSLIKDLKVPIVLIDNHKKFKNIYGVDNDDFGGSYKATKYLIDLGHKRIGYIGYPDKHPLGRECWGGFKKALSDNNLREYCVYKKCRSFKSVIKSGRNAMAKLLEMKLIPSAFFCASDYLAIGAMEVLRSKGYKIPADISFIGMDDMELSSEIEPHLTTVRINMEKLGRVGTKKLISIINNNYNGEVKTIISNEIVERRSCSRIN